MSIRDKGTFDTDDWISLNVDEQAQCWPRKDLVLRFLSPFRIDLRNLTLAQLVQGIEARFPEVLLRGSQVFASLDLSTVRHYRELLFSGCNMYASSSLGLSESL